MNGDPHPDVAIVVLELDRLSRGGRPHTPDSPAAKVIENAIHRLGQEAELAGFAALGRRAFAAAAGELATKPLHSDFTEAAGTPKRKGVRASQTRRS